MLNLVRRDSVFRHSENICISSSIPVEHKGHTMDWAPMLLFSGNILVLALNMSDAVLRFRDSMYFSLCMVCLTVISDFNLL